MCEPTTLMIASMAMTAASGVYSAQAASAQGKYQERVAKNNAMIQQRMAQDALDRGKRDEGQHRLKVAQMKSQQRAKFGASGADVDSGSPLDIIADTAMMGELDALTIRENAQREAYGHRVGAMNTMAQGKLDRAAGRNQAIGTLLTTGGQVAGQWYNYKNPRKPS